jgi:quercetin dioxygenase-like cupin family protein
MPIVDHYQAPEVPWRPGYRKWDIAGREQNITSTFSINAAEPGAGAPLHTHAMDELIVIMEGTLEVRIDGETQVAGKEHTIVIPPGAEHGFTVVGDWTTQLLVFFPTLDPYSPQHTHYLEGRRPASVKD